MWLYIDLIVSISTKTASQPHATRLSQIESSIWNSSTVVWTLSSLRRLRLFWLLSNYIMWLQWKPCHPSAGCTFFKYFVLCIFFFFRLLLWSLAVLLLYPLIKRHQINYAHLFKQEPSLINHFIIIIYSRTTSYFLIWKKRTHRCPNKCDFHRSMGTSECMRELHWLSTTYMKFNCILFTIRVRFKNFEEKWINKRRAKTEYSKSKFISVRKYEH